MNSHQKLKTIDDPIMNDLRKVYKDSGSTPTVSVIIPFFNSNDTLGKTLKSVLDQTFQNFEIIICVDKYSEQPKIKFSDSRIRIIHNIGDPGAGAARYCAVQAAKSRFVSFIDADDEWIHSKLETQMEHMKSEKLVFSFTGYITRKHGSKVAKYTPTGNVELKRFLMKQITICCSSVMIDRSYNPPIIKPFLKKRNDYQMWFPVLEFAMRNNLGCGFLKDAFSIRNVHKNNLTKNKITLPYYNYLFYFSIFQSTYKSTLYCMLNIFFTIYTKIRSKQ